MRTVVGAAIVRGGRVLAARRPAPHSGWELPGGKVEPGESDTEALVREVAEELGCTVAVTGWLPGTTEIGADLVLRVGLARLVAGEPVPHEHDALWWLRPDQLARVSWLTADEPFLPVLRRSLEEAPRPGQAVTPPA